MQDIKQDLKKDNSSLFYKKNTKKGKFNVKQKLMADGTSENIMVDHIDKT